MTARDDLPVIDRLRATADDVARLVGDTWRHQAANDMGCNPRDVGIGPVGRHRDSEALDESNFRVILADLRQTDERVTDLRFRHWGVGWVEEIAVPLDDPALIDRVAHWVGQLASYPVADETDLAVLEAEHIDGVD
jgi:hypothetical protein